MSLFSWLRASNGMADSAQVGRARRGTSPSRRAARFRPRLEALEERVVPATFHVADVAGLQAAVVAINTDPSQPATIALDPGTYDLTSELQIVNANHLTIKRNGTGTVILDNPTHSDRIFEIETGNVTLDGLVITGRLAGAGGGILAADDTLTVENCTISGNSATSFGSGGGIYNFAHSKLSISD